MIWLVAIFGGLFFALILGPVAGLYLFNACKAREMAERRAWEREVEDYLDSCERIRTQRPEINLEYCDEVLSQVETQNATDYLTGIHIVDWN